MGSIKIPAKRRLRQRGAATAQKDEDVTPKSVDEILNKKKTRREQDAQLEQMLSNLRKDLSETAEKERQAEIEAARVKDSPMECDDDKDDPDYVDEDSGPKYKVKSTGYDDLYSDDENKVCDLDFDDDFMLGSLADDDDEEDLDDKLQDRAKEYFDEEAQEKLNQLLEQERNAEALEEMETWHQAFFRSGIKNIRQPALVSREEGTGEKEVMISEMSATPNARAFLFQSGCMKDWHTGGWKCPHYIYQWLFEVVALELDRNTAKNALSTLFALWSLPGSRVETKLPHIYNQRFIGVKTFKNVLLAYDAIPSQLIEGILSDPDSQDISVHKKNEQDFEGSHARHLPVSQLGWMIEAFGFSVRLWFKAYSSHEIRYAVRLLVQMSLDQTGYLVLQKIQTAIDNCLSAMGEASWETELQTIANDICDMVPALEKQIHLFDAVKTINVRSRYLRRVIGVKSMERCLEKEVPGSVYSISTDQSIIQQIYQIFMTPGGFFMKKSNIDYEECWIRVAILDAAIGTDDEEIKQDKDNVLEIADVLRDIGLNIGAHLGVMKKTLANEMIQRVWSRLSYITGKRVEVEF